MCTLKWCKRTVKAAYTSCCEQMWREMLATEAVGSPRKDAIQEL